MVTALTIAGSDPSGGAGLQSDLKTFAAFGVYGASVVTAVTVQTTVGVDGAAPLSADLVTAQIEAVAADMQPHSTKIGMLAAAAIVEAVAAAIVELELPLVVVDPVLVSSSGLRLLDSDGVQTLITELLPRAYVVTPNIPEAEALSGKRIQSMDDARIAATRIHAMGAAAVIITGGHASGDTVIDLLYDGSAFNELISPRVRPAASSDRVHGTGCTYASALAASLALGRTLHESARRAQAYVGGAIAHARALGRGAALLDHFWEQRLAREDAKSTKHHEVL
jgi:hydroxymethylpyrimidine/phosphomethylpyrimidine kinase